MNMTLSEYESWVLEKWGEVEEPLRCLAIMSLGIGGEAGEVQEIIKKSLRPKNKHKAIDREHLKEELGDTLYYLVRIAKHYDMTMAQIISHNVDKLNGYGDTVNK
jgi:NTP pyrophosphatase (non-canonical NTP hydrolase)